MPESPLPVHCYVIVDSDGFSTTLPGHKPELPDHAAIGALPAMLRRGWRPVRETPFPAPTAEGKVYVLVLLERDEPEPGDYSEDADEALHRQEAGEEAEREEE